ncbi:ArsR/SmtB family transcription factor [Paenibacillus sacheonensis]|uniref:ArsR family transcriptional regulator n=1 Tax=Paenibacillus sacheonensis TaxID=742054 RepID=A0A7X4YRT1_9BACL|nr:transcriptional regulator [Paenibacillus sacheonensis]MBM7567514.1 DNA-binding transcriptional ArsR family regulator [Paenibacillus sacheonensis]NBC71381.1 ArsR family transcriptional regulator [Paenibacillus sacheonensis]
MMYSLDVRFKPLFEIMGSLHAYVCRKSHKKLDLSPAWAKEVRQRITPQLAELLDRVQIDGDWKLTYLLVHLCPGEDVGDFVDWLRGMTPGELYELMSPYGNQFPNQMGEFRDHAITLFEQWNEQYFRHIDPAILERLGEEALHRKAKLSSAEPIAFVDETTNGLLFVPMDGLERVILMPQYHFQPINVVSHFGKVTICHYAARLYVGDEEDFLTPHEYRMIRSVSEKSRLKILRYLSQGPRSFIEIVRHLELSKGITHDHISKLRYAGMVTAHFEGETLTAYSVRKSALEQVHSKIMDYIGQGV